MAIIISILKRTLGILLLFTGGSMMYSCSHRHHPSKTVTINTDSIAAKKSLDSLHTAKAIAKKKARVPIPKVIEVNDSAAHKSIDGRLYYDVMGHRYWRNYKDGKYYLFSQSMYSNPDFQPK